MSLSRILAVLALLAVARPAQAACNPDCGPNGSCSGSRCVCSGTLCANGAMCDALAQCCTPMTSAATCAGRCGTVTNNCGTAVNCGSCVAGQVCSNNSCCSPTTCAAAGKNCGSLADGCGGTLNCGTCGGGQVCVNNVCQVSCTPTTCAQAGKNCGTISDGCGGSLNCGGCPAGEGCSAQNVCVAGCSLTTCAAEGKNCGTISDGCGGTLNCGTCTAPNVCGGNGTPNVCALPAVVNQPFAAGSLIIPMDDCYNPDYTQNANTVSDGSSCVPGAAVACYRTASYSGGNIRLPFGLIYFLAANRIPVSIALHPYKLGIGQPDFAVTPPAGATTATVSKVVRSGADYQVDAGQVACGTNPVNYAGMPFIVDAPFADQALKLIALYSSTNSGFFDDVPLHIINYNFGAPILGTMSTRPKPVAIDGRPLDTFFEESGIETVTPGGSTYTLLQSDGGGGFTYTWPAAAVGPHPGCPGNLCNALTYTDANGNLRRIVDVLWAHDGAINNWPALKPFYTTGGTAMVVADATSWEAGSAGKLGGNLFVGQNGAQRGSYCATVAVTGANRWANPGPGVQFPGSNRFLQIGDMNLFTMGGGGGDGSAYGFGASPAYGTQALVSTDDTYYAAIAGHPIVDGNQVPGNIVYLGSLNSWHGNSRGKDAGLHILYNTLLVGGGGSDGTGPIPPPIQFKDAELSRSSPVVMLSGESYLGTFNWKIPEDPLAAGNVLYTADRSQYPFVTGHFREYKPVTGASTLSVSCSASDSTSPCNWDAATLMKPWSQRRIFVGQKVSNAHTLTQVSSLSGDATIQHISTRLNRTVGGQVAGVLGGVDYSTAAVIEGKAKGPVTIAGAQNRPTIAYFGARDGMIHAVCVQPETNATACYGVYARGEEIWAFIPPGVKAQMDRARTAGDWSSVNVGGVMRVGDFQALWDGSNASYRTILIYGTRESGHVGALDISNPSPGRANSDGFKFLWENDGTDVEAGVASHKMGPTQGASIASFGRGGAAVVTAAVTPAAGSTQSGVNTYILRLKDGKVLAVDHHLYTRKIPLAAGSTGDLPNDVPALPTLVDSVDDTTLQDDTAFVPDFEGRVRKLRLNASTQTFDTGSGAVFDAGSGCNGLSCQPIGASVTIGRRGTTGTLTALVITGGADWARSATRQSYVYGFDVRDSGTTAQLKSAVFTSQLGTVTMPTGNGPAATSVAFPTRGYAPVTVAGSDLYAQVTTLSLGSINQLIMPTLYPGTYGTVLRWGNVNSTIDSTAVVLIAQGQNFSGGMAAVAQTNTTATDGAITVAGATGTLRQSLSANSTSLRNLNYAINKTPTSQRLFDLMTWFDLSN